MAYRSGRVAGVVLAAGSSTRMGRNKLLFEVGGEALVRRVARTAQRAGLDPVLVVLGHEAEAVRCALLPVPCQFVINPRYAEGMNSSACVGIAALPAGVAAGVLLLADMPLVDAAMIAEFVAQYRCGDSLLILSDYDGVNAPPTLIDGSLFAEFVGEVGRGCSKRLRQRHAGQLATVSLPARALADLDVPEDYERITARLAAM